ncbi:MAG: hypothetical protein JF599_00875 [Verrucomicrobia bacterium]|nr:hypothetical protein [Verrucomicrobiota bacterium]
MAFDSHNQNPSVNPRKRTTKVNVGMVIGILLFFILTGWVIWRVAHRPPQSPADIIKPHP